jgi:hypothetical protein
MKVTLEQEELKVKEVASELITLSVDALSLIETFA